MLKAALFVWEQLPIEMPYTKVQQLLSSENSGTCQQGLSVLDPIIQHGFFLQSPEAAGRIQKRLLQLLDHPKWRQVARSSASLCASILARHSNDLTEFEKSVSSVLKGLKHSNRVDVFIDVIFEISQRYNPLLKDFVRPCLNLLNSLYGTLKVCLITC